MLAHLALAVPERHAPTGLVRLESGTAPPAVLSTTWALDLRIADSSGLLSCPDGQRNAAASECLAAVQEAARAHGMLVRGLDVVGIGADGVVPVGCSYSRKSKKALFNTNPAGGRFGFGHERYALVCMVAGAAAAAPGADSPSTPLDGPPTVLEGAGAGSRALSFAPSGAGCPDGQRNAAESECLVAVQGAARTLGMLVRGLDVVDIGADGVVPAGCSYSRKSKKALFNTNGAGPFGNDRYDVACVIAGTAVTPAADAPPTASDGPPTASKGADTGTRALSFVPSGGWGNQVVGLQHALFFAKATHRALLVPRVMDHYDVQKKAWSNMTCSGGAYNERDVRAQLSIYQAVAPYRPLVTSFLDSSAFNVPAAVDSRLAACEVGAGADEGGCTASRRCINDVYMTGQEDVPKEEKLMKTTTIIASKLSRYEDELLEFGVMFHAATPETCMCAIRYRDDLVERVRALGMPVLGTEYDALHLRITEIFGRSWDPASTVRAALAANTSRLLYVASDNLDKALELIRAEGSPRRVVTRRDLDAQRVADVLGYLPLAERRRAEFMRELLVDVLTCVHATDFFRGDRYQVKTTFSNHIEDQRHCRARPPAESGFRDCSEVDVAMGVRALSRATAVRRLPDRTVP
jgi:hypothetical protein